MRVVLRGCAGMPRVPRRLAGFSAMDQFVVPDVL